LRPRSPLWRHPDFLKLWAGDTVSLIGSQVTLLALPLTAALTLDASPLQMGLLTTAGTLPSVVLGLFAGVWADRVSRRPGLIAANLASAGLLALVPLAAMAGVLRLELLYVVSALLSACGAFFVAAYQAYVPALVGESNLVDANTKFEQSASVARIAGPGLGGALVQALTAPIAIAVDAFSFIVAAACLGWIRLPETVPPRASKSSVGREIWEGLRVVATNPVLRALAGVWASATLFNSAFFALYLLYLTRELAVPPVWIGGILAVAGPAALLGTFAVGPFARWLGVGPSLCVSLAAAVAGRSVVPLAAGPLALILPLLGAGEFTRAFINPNFSVAMRTAQQIAAPAEMRARVGASFYVLGFAPQPIGALAGGLLGEVLGVRTTLFLSILGSAVFGFLALWPIRNVRDVTPTSQ
jgi:MFS family permease